MKHLGDITRINGANVPPVNVIIGSSPCQDLSIAGRREGLAGERSGLFMEQIRIIKEMRCADEQHGRTSTNIRPRYMVWENVPGAFTSNNGQDFKSVLKATIKIIEENCPDIPIPEGGWHYSGCIMGDGFSVAWRVFDAQFWGTPQRRRRIALVADFGGATAPEILFERESVSRNTPSSETPWEIFAAVANERFGATDSNGPDQFVAQTPKHNIINATSGSFMNFDDKGLAFTLSARDYKDPQYVCLNSFDCQSKRVFDTSGVAPTLASGTNEGMNIVPSVLEHSTVRRLTPLECERLQGFPDGWTDIGDYIDTNGKKRKTSDTARYKALGNSIALPSWVWVLERLSSYCGDKPTMASLFDGIGGFPLILETLNGQGSCLWVSEIEEFPIAVTRYHFSDT